MENGMNTVRTWITVGLLSLVVGAMGCKKKQELSVTPQEEPAKPEPVKAEPPPAEPPKTDPAPTATSPTDEDKSDWLKVVADHTEAGKGTVDVVFKGVKVVKAAFDPEKVEGGTAELEVDLDTLASGIAKRDAHLKSGDYLDVKKTPKAIIKVDNVKKTADNNYSADATIKAHGIEKKFPVTFTVVETMPDGIRIKGELAFTRADFKIGKVEGDNVKPELKAALQVTLKKS